jgi:DNA-binding CsgD family transcriptional regulator
MTARSALDLERRQQQMRAALDEVLAGLSEAEADALRVADGRTIREVLAHLVLTERMVRQDLLLMLAIDHPELPSIRRLDDRSHLSRVIEEAGTLAGLRAALEDACAATLAVVASLDEEQEARTGHSPELGNVLAASHAALNVSYHYRGHIEELHACRRQLSHSA